MPRLTRCIGKASLVAMSCRAGITVALLAWPALTVAAPARSYQYTRIDKCRTIELNDDEGGWSVQMCPGLAGYRLKVIEGDLRQDMTVLLPGGGERSLGLTESAVGFNSLGTTVEWRGSGRGRAFRPDALILRWLVVEDAEHPERPTSYLLTVSLAKPRPCVTARIAPGPGQNERARRIADGPAACLR